MPGTNVAACANAYHGNAGSCSYPIRSPGPYSNCCSFPFAERYSDLFSKRGTDSGSDIDAGNPFPNGKSNAYFSSFPCTDRNAYPCADNNAYPKANVCAYPISNACAHICTDASAYPFPGGGAFSCTIRGPYPCTVVNAHSYSFF